MPMVLSGPAIFSSWNPIMIYAEALSYIVKYPYQNVQEVGVQEDGGNKAVDLSFIAHGVRVLRSEGSEPTKDPHAFRVLEVGPRNPLEQQPVMSVIK